MLTYIAYAAQQYTVEPAGSDCQSHTNSYYNGMIVCITGLQHCSV